MLSIATIYLITITNIILMNFFKLFLFLFGLCLLVSCVGNLNPTGGNSRPNYPYFITTKPLVVKKILVPTGTLLTYEESFFKEGEQDQIMSEEKLTDIKLPIGQTLDWGGVPISWISKFFNSEMCGFTVYANFNQLSNNKKTKFSELWQSCDDGLGITVKKNDDWSFNKNNISDVQSCSVLYQRYFKKDKEQQLYLDSIYTEIQRVRSK